MSAGLHIARMGSSAPTAGARILCSNCRMTSGYSATPQARKLGLKPGMRVAIDHAPPGWGLIDPPPYEEADDGPAELVICFIRAVVQLDERIADLGRRIFPAGSLWIAWPRKVAGHVSDVSENSIRDAILPLGLVDVKVAALDEDWSGLKIMWRRECR